MRSNPCVTCFCAPGHWQSRGLVELPGEVHSNFSRRCPGVAYGTAAVQEDQGDLEAARATRHEFWRHAQDTVPPRASCGLCPKQEGTGLGSF